MFALSYCIVVRRSLRLRSESIESSFLFFSKISKTYTTTPLIRREELRELKRKEDEALSKVKPKESKVTRGVKILQIDLLLLIPIDPCF